MPATMTRPNIGLSDHQMEDSLRILTGVLSDLHVLYVRTRNYHWNVTGPQFHSLHELFEKQYKQMAEAIDEVAERMRYLGGHADATMTEFLKHARLKENPGDHPNARRMLENLASDHDTVIRQLREDVDRTAEEIQDQGTSDFLLGLMKDHEKMAWMLRSFLEGPAL